MIGEDLQRRRLALKLTQEQLARRLGISERAVRYYESRRRNVPELVALAMRHLERYVPGHALEPLPLHHRKA